MKFYQHTLCFCFALLRKNFTFPLHCIFIPVFVIIKSKFVTNLINTSVCDLADKDISHLQRMKTSRL